MVKLMLVLGDKFLRRKEVRMAEKHFFVVYIFVSDEARKVYLIPPEQEIHQRKESQNESRLKTQWATAQGVCKRGVVMKKFFVVGSPRTNRMFTGS
jgi:hypothetical protein